MLENVKKDDLEQVKQLPKGGSTYSIGACDAAIKNVTLYIADLYEILNEKSAVLKEKEKSIKVLQETTEKNVALEQEITDRERNISELRDQIRDLTIEKDKQEATIKKLEETNSALQDKLRAETDLRISTQKDLEVYREQLGSAIQDTEAKGEQREQELKASFSGEIERIQQVIANKDDEIEEKVKEINELKKINEELGKAGTIPDIVYEYKGKASIIGVCARGSYGVSSLTYTLAKCINEQKSVLIVDLDFKNGNIGKYVRSDNKAIENLLRGGPIIKEHVINSRNKGVLDYIGGVEKDWTPYDVISIDWSKIFESEQDYDYILVDCGIYGGYNIQTKIADFVSRIGKLVYIYKEDWDKDNKFIKIKNFASDNTGIPFVSRIISDGTSLWDNALTQTFIKTNYLNSII